MSFFDEADEPRAAPRTTPRSRRPSGSGRRPPSDQQAIQTRRIIAAVVIVVLLIAVVLGVRSCQISARNSALRDYANSVSSLISQTNTTNAQMFQQLSSGKGAGNPQALSIPMSETSVAADGQLSKAEGLSVPDEMKPAQQNLTLALKMRSDGIKGIGAEIQPALGGSTSTDAVNAIAADMARIYAGYVVYQGYSAPEIASALHGAGIPVGGANGVTIQSAQWVPDLGWLTPSFVATKLGSSVATPTGKVAPGLHGHSLDSVSVGGTTLQTGSTNTLPANPAPTFTLTITNGGTNNETNVACKVTVSGTKISGQTVIPQTTAGQQTTCQVPLSSPPPPGNYTVTATVQPVPGEKNTSNNTMSFPVTFQ